MNCLMACTEPDSFFIYLYVSIQPFRFAIIPPAIHQRLNVHLLQAHAMSHSINFRQDVPKFPPRRTCKPYFVSFLHPCNSLILLDFYRSHIELKKIFAILFKHMVIIDSITTKHVILDLKMLSNERHVRAECMDKVKRWSMMQVRP